MSLFLLERSLASPRYRHLIFIGLECAMNSHRASRLLKDLRTMSIGLGPIRRLHFRRAIRERESHRQFACANQLRFDCHRQQIEIGMNSARDRDLLVLDLEATA